MRSFVWRQAEGLGLNGFVRNLPDGRVEVVAEGDPALLEQLVRDLKRSPVGRINKIAVASTGPASGKYRSFTIEY
ncbi:MAG: acylphosphatase [Clostridia bacterium]|nr:MAG: acylphosphatase [Clostridia bacterium]